MQRKEHLMPSQLAIAMSELGNVATEHARCLRERRPYSSGEYQRLAQAMENVRRLLGYVDVVEEEPPVES